MEELIVQIEQGKLRGKAALDYKGGRYYSFQGIPYAKQPAGELRFKAPQNPEPWQGIRDCTQEASESISRHMIFQFKVGSEYCLYLNVYTPQLATEESSSLKPVMVWIHGGAFITGSSKTDIYGPEYLMTGNVVLVTLNYRLGILGFLSMENPALNVPGNNGLKDIIQALNWVQKNIHTFNGDAGNVTIFGNGAGAAAVHLLMLSPMAEGLFHRAIMQSGCALNPWVKGTQNVHTIAKVFAFENDNEGEILEMLLLMKEEKFLEAQNEIPDVFGANQTSLHGFVVEQPCKEANLLTVEPLDVMLAGEYTKVPLLIGYTSREGMFSEIGERLQTGAFKIFTDFETKVPVYFNIPKGSDLSKRIAQKIKEFYFDNCNPSVDNVDSIYKLETDLMFYRGLYTTIKHHLKHSEHPTYFYRFSADTDLNWNKSFGKITTPGAAHMDDLGYLFKTTFLPNFKEKSKEDMLVQKMVQLWTNFAKNGNPNPTEDNTNIDVIWKPAKENELHYLEINEELTLGSNPDQERMTFWDEITDMCPGAKNM
ncbi:alpha-Esterase-9 [Carabus blaptoides fortunei]